LRLPVAIVLAVVALVASERTPVHAQAEPRRAGDGVDALPGVHEVPVATASEVGWGTRLGLGYGWTESVLEMNDQHHRLQLDAAGSVTPLRWLSFALRVAGRYDAHSGDASDDGVVTETHAAMRVTRRLGPALHAGAELGLRLPGGSSVADALSALSGGLQLLLSYAPPQSPLTLGLALGLVVDRSKHAGGDLRELSASDRLALGVSDSLLAARQGLAVSYRTGPVEWIAEWAFRMYFAHVAESPMWIRAGARVRPAERLQLELLLGVSPSKRPSFAEGAPLVVAEPRLSAGLSASYAWSTESAPPKAASIQLAAAPVPPPKPPATLRGQLLTPSGTGLAGATVTLRRGDVSESATSDAQGAYAFAALPQGQYELSVRADGFSVEPQTIALNDGDAPELRLTLKRELPQGQIRGTVRRFNGKPVVAAVAIASLGLDIKTEDDGTFEIDVPPGEYTVAVTARGFRPQTRKARVELHGVAILVVELEAAK
jgi:hypothetical protein